MRRKRQMLGNTVVIQQEPLGASATAAPVFAQGGFRVWARRERPDTCSAALLHKTQLLIKLHHIWRAALMWLTSRLVLFLPFGLFCSYV